MSAPPTPLRPAPAWANLGCGCAESRGTCNHGPVAPPPDGLGGCDECDPLPSAYPDANADVVMMSGMCGSPVDVDPEVALRELVSALRARHHTPPGQRPVQTNGWTAADEFELIMRRWRATLDRGKMGEITVGKRKADRAKSTPNGSRSTCKSACRLRSSRPSGMSPPRSSAPIPCAVQ